MSPLPRGVLIKRYVFAFLDDIQLSLAAKWPDWAAQTMDALADAQFTSARLVHTGRPECDLTILGFTD